MRVIQCDRCKAAIPSEKDTVGVVSLTTASLRSTQIKINPYKGWDLCADCYEEIRKFIDMNPNEEPKKTKIPEGFKAVDIKPRATIRKPVTGASLSQEKIDMIRQMAQDGKTVKEICDYTGVSEPTVRKYKKEVCDETTEPAAEGVSED